MSYQFIVIISCEIRKQKIINAFKELELDDRFIYYLNASTPDNSEEYFIDITNNNEPVSKKTICCAKSHCRAIEYAANDSSPEYSIILEDDAAFYKTDFLKIIEEIIINWEIHFQNCQYISLGWIPCSKYETYLSKQHKKIESITNINEQFIFLNDFQNVGLQCYMVKKHNIREISQILNKPTYNEFKTSLNKALVNIYGENFVLYSSEAVDYFLNRLMKYEIIFPPLVIEQNNTPSLLGHNNFENYWNNFFKGHEGEMKKYMTY